MYKIIRSSRLYEQIVQQVEESIHKGALKAGDQLPPGARACGAVWRKPDGGARGGEDPARKGAGGSISGTRDFITDGSSNTIRQSLHRMMRSGNEGFAFLAEVREILEPEIAALATTRADQEDLAAMKEQVEVMDASKADPDAFIEADLDFHLALAEAAGNPIILSLIDSIVGLLREQRIGIFQVKGGAERGQYHHKKILEAIEHRDSAGAREAMKAHLKQVREDSRMPQRIIQRDLAASDLGEVRSWLN